MIECGKSNLLEALYKLLCKCWEKGEVPQDMRDANIITLYTNKGDRSDCNNYRGISLLSIIGKLFARIALTGIQKLADQVYPELQGGFRSKRSTTHMVFSLRQLQEKCREQHQSLYIAFIDLTKAFELVRAGLFKILPLIGCPPRLMCSMTAKHLQNVWSKMKPSKVAHSPQRSLEFSLPFYSGTPSREQHNESTTTPYLMVSSLTSAV